MHNRPRPQFRTVASELLCCRRGVLDDQGLSEYRGHDVYRLRIYIGDVTIVTLPRERDDESAALAWYALHRNAAAVHLGHAPHQRQSQPGASVLPRQTAVQLHKCLE